MYVHVISYCTSLYTNSTFIIVFRIYLSANSSESEGSSSPGSQVSVLSPFHSELETNSRVIEAFSIPSVPIHAFQAFQLLSASAEAQVIADVL